MAKVEQSSKLASDLSNKFDTLFPTWPTMVATLLSLTIIVIVFTKFFYNPIKKMHDERKKYIQNNIQSAVKENTNAILDREEANKELIKARLKAKKIIDKTIKEALELRNKKITIAQKDAQKVISDANKKIESEKIKFEEESKKVIIEIALSAAEKVVEKEVDTKINRKIIEDFIKVKK